MIGLILTPVAGLSGETSCLAVDGEWVLAGDVAELIPRYAGVDPAVRLVRAPFPGARRVVDFPSPERPAPEPPSRLCVERRLRPMTRDAVTEALRKPLTVND